MVPARSGFMRTLFQYPPTFVSRGVKILPRWRSCFSFVGLALWGTILQLPVTRPRDEWETCVPDLCFHSSRTSSYHLSYRSQLLGPWIVSRRFWTSLLLSTSLSRRGKMWLRSQLVLCRYVPMIITESGWLKLGQVLQKPANPLNGKELV